MRSIVIIGMAAASLVLSGCATTQVGSAYSDAKLASMAAEKFGVQPSEVSISNRRSDLFTLTFDVSIPSRGIRTRCDVDSNVLLARVAGYQTFFCGNEQREMLQRYGLEQYVRN